MKEYVEREALFKLLEDEERYGYFDGVDIANIPVADVAEVVHGEWIYARTYYEADECNCSICRQLMTTHRGKRMKYCPNCGAKMDREKENE